MALSLVYSEEVEFLPSSIQKRDGQTQEAFKTDKIGAAIRAAWRSVGLVDELTLETVIGTVLSTLPSTDVVHVEGIQDAVEIALMRHGHHAVAKAFILYREKRREARLVRDRKPDPRALRDYILAAKYARHRSDLGRREVRLETVARVETMHLDRFPHMEGEIRRAFDLVRDERVLPSMRSMQFAGPAILTNMCRLYNCCYSLVDRLEVFGEAMFLLLSGCGVGYSVQFDHVAKLPAVGRVDPKRIRHHVIDDNIEGWADALKALVRSYQTGEFVEFSYHLIRPAGSPLRTAGGRAPGHVKLKESLERVRAVLDAAQGRKLRPIECHRILCLAADTALSGGIRRSAMISLFSLGDSEMVNAKTGDWFVKDPWFANANNSVCLKRNEVREKEFRRIFGMTREWGEPGFYFTNHPDHGCNPCNEIGLNPVLDGRTGWAFCNLTEINAAKLSSKGDFILAARAATLIGTLQAAYTEFPYLGEVSEQIARREALLGVSMTGMLDSPRVACEPTYQREMAGRIRDWNREFAAQIGIRPAARTTCVKPSGTASLALGGVASGHHAHHARRYLRRVIADEHEAMFQAFRAQNPHMCIRKPDGKWVIEFPVEAPPGAIVKKDLDAIQFLEGVRSTQTNWVIPGTADETHSPGLTHNVSNTVHVRDDEWERVADYLWDHRNELTGVSLLAATGDKDYAFAPMEEIVTEADEARWNELLASYDPIDYAALREDGDSTSPASEPACAGGACSLV